MKGPNDLCSICWNTGYTKNVYGEKVPCSNDCKVLGGNETFRVGKADGPPAQENPAPPAAVHVPPSPSLGAAKEAISEGITFDYLHCPTTFEIIPPTRDTSFYIEEFWLWWPQLESHPVRLKIDVNGITCFDGHAAAFLAGPIKLAAVISGISPVVLHFEKIGDTFNSITTVSGAVVMRGQYAPPMPLYPSQPWPQQIPQAPCINTGGTGGNWCYPFQNGWHQNHRVYYK